MSLNASKNNHNQQVVIRIIQLSELNLSKNQTQMVVLEDIATNMFHLPSEAMVNTLLQEQTKPNQAQNYQLLERIEKYALHIKHELNLSKWIFEKKYFI